MVQQRKTANLFRLLNRHTDHGHLKEANKKEVAKAKAIQSQVQAIKAGRRKVIKRKALIKLEI